MRQYENHESVPMYGVSPALQPRIDELGLEPVLEQLEHHGYGVIEDAAPAEITGRLRDAILRLVDETDGRLHGYQAALLLGRDPVIAEAVLNPKILAVAEFMVGQGALISQVLGSVKPEGSGPLVIHADQNWTPAPFPEHAQLVTFCWACDDFTAEGGATRVIPESHRHRRHPSPDEAREAAGAVPIECRRGSVAVWDGAVWHGNYPRTIPGDRVVLHLTYSRVALRPIEDYSHLGDAFLEGQPETMRSLLGRDSFFGSTTSTSGAADMKKFAELALASKR